MASILATAATSACALGSSGTIDEPETEVSSTTEPLAVDRVFDFEDGTTQGWGVGWGGAFDEAAPPVSVTDPALFDGGHALAVAVHYRGGSWEEANVQAYIAKTGEKVDVREYEGVEYDLFVPHPEAFEGALKVQTAFNDDWGEASDFVDVDVRSLPTVVKGGVPYGKLHVRTPRERIEGLSMHSQVVIRLAASKATYRGTVLVDDVRLTALRTPRVKLVSPRTLDTVSGVVKVEARVYLPNGTKRPRVTLVTPAGEVVRLEPSRTGTFRGSWSTAGESDGFAKVRVDVRAGQEVASTTTEVRIVKSGLRVRILEPALGAAAEGPVHVVAAVESKLGLPVDGVEARLGRETAALRRTAPGVYAGTFDAPPEGSVATLVVTARSGRSVLSTQTDVVGRPAETSAFVRACGTRFCVGDEPFSYAGFNAYDLPFKYERRLAQNEKVVLTSVAGNPTFDVLEEGSVLTPEGLVDRTMVEAKKLGLNVVRTWAFNSDANDPHAYFDANDAPREEQLRRLDYVIDSARRHGIRVILALENYWSDYGGIAVTAQRYGVSKLEFFTDPRCKAAYRAHVATFVDRVNTLTGVRYGDDPILLGWDLMNEPRMDCQDDTTPKKQLCDPKGRLLHGWIREMSAYVKELAPRQLVAAGAEGHGYDGWGRIDEGYGADPMRVMDAPAIDFLTYHPYFNASWSRFTLREARALVDGLVHSGLERGKPVVMEEWGLNVKEPVFDFDGRSLSPSHPAYAATRAAWYRTLPAIHRRAGGAGANVWMLQTNLQDTSYGVSLYTPAEAVMQDGPLAAQLRREAAFARALDRAPALVDLVFVPPSVAGAANEAAYRGLVPPALGQRFFAPHALATDCDVLRVLRSWLPRRLEGRCADVPVDVESAARIVSSALSLDCDGDALSELVQRGVFPAWRSWTPLSRGMLAVVATRLVDLRELEWAVGSASVGIGVPQNEEGEAEPKATSLSP